MIRDIFNDNSLQLFLELCLVGRQDILQLLRDGHPPLFRHAQPIQSSESLTMENELLLVLISIDHVSPKLVETIRRRRSDTTHLGRKLAAVHLSLMIHRPLRLLSLLGLLYLQSIDLTSSNL